MSTPPSNEPPDELIAAYRRASAQQSAGPGPMVRDAILSKARASRAAGGVNRSKAVDWRWKAAASLVVVGVGGLLAVQSFRNPPHDEAATGATASPPPVAVNAPDAQMRLSEAPAAAPALSAAPPARAVAPANPQPRRLQRSKVAGTSEVAPGASPRDNASLAATLDQKRNADAVSAQIGTSNGVQAPAARVAAGKQAPTAPTAPAPPWQDHIVAALRANYPELFVRPADAGSVHIVMILYANGSVYRSARQQASTAAPAALAAAGGAPTETDATAQISQSLGVQAAELAVPAQTVVLNAAAGVPGSVTVVFGVLTAEASAAHTTPR